MQRIVLWALLLFYASWGAASSFALFSNDAALFQSSGVLGIASALMLFGRQKELAGDLGEELRAQELELIRLEVELEFVELSDSLMQDRMSGLRDGISKIVESETDMQALDEMECRVASHVPKIAKLRDKIASQKQEIFTQKEILKKIATGTARSEISVVSLATIQTGFGERIASIMSGA